MYSGKFYFEESGFKLIENDTFETLKKFEEKVFNSTDFCPLKINERTLMKFCTTMKILTPTDK